jgi:uncharacterized protein
MSPTTAAQAVAATFRSAAAQEFRQVRLKYAGGEPTLNLPALQAAQGVAERLREASGIALQTALMTNGVALSEAVLDYLAAHEIGLSISMDGLGAYHDAARPAVDGHPTAARVRQNLARGLAQGLRTHVSITLTAHNLAGLDSLVGYLLKLGVPFTFNFARPVAGREEPLPNPAALVDALQRAYAVIAEKLPHYSLLGALSDRADLRVPHAHTCGVGRSYIVYGVDGGVHGCHMDQTEPVASVQDADPLAVLQARVSRQNPPVEEKPACRDCRWAHFCTGGCPRLAYQASGRYNGPAPLCEVYRAILPEVVRLEGLRLLKYTEPLQFS